jgi:WD40 repeat protein
MRSMQLLMTWWVCVATPAAFAGDESSRTDRWGDSLPQNALARLGTNRFRTASYPEWLVFSPDGETLTCHAHKQIYLWQAPTGKLLRTWSTWEPGKFWGSYSIHFSKDGKSLIHAQEKRVRMFATATGKEQRSFPIPDAPSHSALSDDGLWLATSQVGDPYRVFDLASGKDLGQLPWKGDYYLNIAWIPGTKSLAVLTLDYERGPLLRFWDVATGKVRRFRLPPHPDEESRMAFSPDGKTMAITQKNNIQLYELATGKKGARLSGHTERITGLLFSSVGDLLASASDDNTLRLWALENGKSKARPIVVKIRGSSWTPIAFSPNGKWLAAPGKQQEVRLIDTATGKDLPTAGGPVHSATPIGFMPDHRTLLVSYGQDGYRLWDTKTAKEVGKAGPQAERGWRTLSRDGRYLAVAAGDQSLEVWDMQAGKTVLTAPIPPPGTTTGGHHVAFSPDDRILAAGNVYGTVSLYEVGAWKLLHRFTADRFGLWDLAFSPDSKVLAISGCQAIQGWDVSNAKHVWRRSIDHPEIVYRLAFSPDGRTLACGGHDWVTLREVRTGDVRARLAFPENDAAFSRIAFSPDGRMLAGTSSNGFAVWEVFSRNRGFHRHESWGFSGGMAWSQDGAAIATAAADSTVLIWDARKLRPNAVPAKQTMKELEAALNTLGADSESAFQAIATLIQMPEQTVAMIRDRYRPAKRVDKQRVVTLLADLDSEAFKVRDQAATALGQMGDSIYSVLEEALPHSASLEKNRRVQQLLEPWGPMGAERARFLRVLEVVDWLPSAEADHWLREIADGAADVFRTDAARASLEMRKRSGRKPR